METPLPHPPQLEPEAAHTGAAGAGSDARILIPFPAAAQALVRNASRARSGFVSTHKLTVERGEGAPSAVPYGPGLKPRKSGSRGVGILLADVELLEA